ncbi:MAG: U32 family peptidase [Alphaproteobacteria bacterium]|nr:U32 family peptidase [Alphaproteobacteria bacterium]
MALGEITLGPVLFNWPAEQWRDFYYRIADEAPVSTVYIGEVVCSKRAPLFADHIESIVRRLEAAGKLVVFSTLAEVALAKDRQIVESVCAAGDNLIEANDTSALYHLKGRPHHVGPFINVYSEHTVAFLARNGAVNLCVPPELPAAALAVICASMGSGVTTEVLAFGRIPLALSARCYHARAHGRTKDSCQFVCDQDADGLPLRTLEDQPFLTINGVQTMSHEYLCLLDELHDLRDAGVSRFRLSPHSCDMVDVASAFRRVLDGDIAPSEARAKLTALNLPAPLCNGFYHAKPGYRWVGAKQTIDDAGQ